MEKPIISLYSAAIRPQNWLQIFESVCNSSIPFEMIFVGPTEPDYILPDNFKFIKTDVKPAQCYEIAARYSMGEYLLNTADDCVFITQDALGTLYREYKAYNDEKLMLSCRFKVNSIDQSPKCHSLDREDPNSFIMPIGGLLSKKLYMELGGIDKNFISVYWDLDIALRLYSSGGRVLLSEDVYNNETSAMHLSVATATAHYGGYDLVFVNALWRRGGNIQLNRTQPFEPFSDENILIESQGPKGRWV